MRFEPIGESGQRRLLNARVSLIGCGALGSVLAETLCRAGVGFLRIADRDFLELSNLQRQVLFDESDVAQRLPKAEAARRKLGRINAQVTVEALVEDVNCGNVASIIDGADLILDGTDNFETRFLINDVAIKHGVPWIYGACVSATGLMMPILPGETPCLQCVFESAPPPELSPTCDTVGVIGPVVGVVAGLQAAEALKILCGRLDAVSRKLTTVDLWAGRLVTLDVGPAPGPTCPCCGLRQFQYLDGARHQSVAVLCGRDAVQINPPHPAQLHLGTLAEKLAPVSAWVTHNAYLLQARIGELEIAVFPSGRTIVKGTHNASEARSLVARYVGN